MGTNHLVLIQVRVRSRAGAARMTEPVTHGTREAKTPVVAFTVTLCWPVRLGDSHRSWVSETVKVQGVSPISTV